MKRIVSVWLPMWPIERLRRYAAREGVCAPGLQDETPLAIVSTRHDGGACITALNETALREGVRVGMALADARAALPRLASRPAEPARDRSALVKLARWAGRYGPLRNRDGMDGLWIDITGVAHLFGGEPGLLADLSQRLARMRVSTRLGLADTPGAAHALARFTRKNEPWTIAPAGGTRAALAALPVDGLRLEPATVLLLKRLGLRRIGQLYDLPRESLERRFRSLAASPSRRSAESAGMSASVLARLDQALGMREEPRRALGEPPVLAARALYAEPLVSSEAIEAEAVRLVETLCRDLAAQALGCRRIRLSLYRADGTQAEITAGLSAPCRTGHHLMSLIRERLSSLDAGFGIDALALDALAAERLEDTQAALAPELAQRGLDAPAAGLTTGLAAALVDRLTQRLGTGSVLRLAARASHIPERAEAHLPALAAIHYEPPWPYAKGPPRPPLLFATPEPIAVMAEVPEGPPLSFSWRRVRRPIVRAEGPERIGAEWWRLFGARGETDAAPHCIETASEPGDIVPPPPPGRPRDYYRIEDAEGGAYWVFREGLYQRTAEDGPPRWFLHGLFG